MSDDDYKEEMRPGWSVEVAGWDWEEWRAHGTLLGWKKTGWCPYCHHSMTAYQKILFETRGVEVDAVCNCPGEHANRPAGITQGCGRHGLIPPHVPSSTEAEL